MVLSGLAGAPRPAFLFFFFAFSSSLSLDESDEPEDDEESSSEESDFFFFFLGFSATSCFLDDSFAGAVVVVEVDGFTTYGSYPP